MLLSDVVDALTASNTSSSKSNTVEGFSCLGGKIEEEGLQTAASCC
jgi:hypothetical protein